MSGLHIRVIQAYFMNNDKLTNKSGMEEHFLKLAPVISHTIPFNTVHVAGFMGTSQFLYTRHTITQTSTQNQRLIESYNIVNTEGFMSK